MNDEMEDRFSRAGRLIGQASLSKLQQSRVVVVGLGAVGSYAIEGLARLGVGHFRLVDFDRVQKSNINRQLYALESSLGRAKVNVAKERVLDINPRCEVQALELFAHVDTFDRILDGDIDIVIDAIDSLTPKLALIEAAHNRNLELISSMGAALRRDPCAVRTARLSKTKHCPLARNIRKKLRNRNCRADPLCVYSTELINDLPDDAMASIESSDDHLVDRGRKRRTLGSLPTVTGVFGLVMADLVMRKLAG